MFQNLNCNNKFDFEDIAVSHYNTLPDVLKGFSLPKKIVIYDSTLRDGEQMPGLSFSQDQKLSIARKLDEIGIPEIEAGFPAISENEKQTIKKISKDGLDAKILVLSRLKKEDIDTAIESDADIVLLFIASSDIHLRFKLHCSQQEIENKIISSIDYAKDHGIVPSFSTEDSTRTSLNFLTELYEIAIKTGAKRIGVTDTVGCATPQTINYIISHVKNKFKIPISAHLHNDFGLGLINAIFALNAGATHICTTINGWGERAGNISLEQLVMALKILYNKNLGIDTTKFYELSKMVSQYSRIPIPITQPFTGENIFSHESGIHVAAIIENPRTYEPISPELVGNKRNIMLGKHSGKHIIKLLLDKYGIEYNDELVKDLVLKIKDIGEKYGYLSNPQIDSIIKGIARDKINEKNIS